MYRFLMAAAAALVAAAGPAAAQDYPTRPINVVVPYAAGGPVDTVTRIIAARMSELLGQQQSGLPRFRFGALVSDLPLVRQARDLAAQMVAAKD